MPFDQGDQLTLPARTGLGKGPLQQGTHCVLCDAHDLRGVVQAFSEDQKLNECRFGQREIV